MNKLNPKQKYELTRKGEMLINEVFAEHPEIKEELEYLKTAKVPRCPHCKKDFVNGVDSITKKVSKHIWVYDCNCVPEDKRGAVMIG